MEGEKEPAFVSGKSSAESITRPTQANESTTAISKAQPAANTDDEDTAVRLSANTAATEKALFDENERKEKIHRLAVLDRVKQVLFDADNFAHEFNTAIFADHHVIKNQELAADPENQIDVRSMFRNTVIRTGNDCNMLVKDMIYAFDSYERFLDAQITPVDRFFVDDENSLHALVQHGIRGSGQPMTADQFQRTKQHELELHEQHRRLTAQQRNIGQLYSADFTNDSRRFNNEPVLRALAEREERNRTGDMRTVIFVRANNDEGQEVSGYIDYSASLYGSSNLWREIFAGHQRVLPHKYDLSYYNWHTGFICQNSTRNFKVFIPPEQPMRMMLLCRDDRKVVVIGPYKKSERDATTVRTEIDLWPTQNDGDQKRPQYLQMILYDHANRAFFNRPPSVKVSRRVAAVGGDDIMVDSNINTGAHYEKKVPVQGVHLVGKASQFGKVGKK